MSGCRSGFKLIDLMVAVFVVAIVLALAPAFVHNGRGDGRRVQCLNHMRQIGLALLNFTTANNHLPNAGTFRDDPDVHQGDPTKSSIYRSIVDFGKLPNGADAWLYNWVVEIMPYLDQPDLANPWDKSAPYFQPASAPTIPGEPANGVLSNTRLGVLHCPDDPTPYHQGNLSYVVNGGFTRWPAIPVGWAGSPIDGQPANGGVRQWAPAGSTWQESQSVGRQLGVMFLGTHTGDQPWDVRSTPRAISDGSSNTIMVGESILAGASSGNRYSHGVATNWACPLPNFSMFLASDDVCQTSRSADDCPGGQLALRPGRVDGPGWARANHRGTYEHINYGSKLTAKGSFPFVNSGHPGGANFVFCDGATRFIADTIDGTVHAKLITPAGSRLPEAIRQGPLSQDDFAQ